MYNYHEFGLVNTKDMLLKAYKEGYAVPAFYPISLEQMNAITDIIIEKRSPLIVLASSNLEHQLEPEMLVNMVKGAIDRVHHAGLNLPIALHLDHGKSYETCVEAIDNGFSSVMIDGSMLSFEENIALTKKVVEYAHKKEVTVEAELGTLTGIEEDGENEVQTSKYTDPKKAAEFIKRTGCDSLAVSVGTCHGLVKMIPNENGELPPLAHNILSEIAKLVPDFPLVLHGSSNIEQKYVEMINNHGGNISKTIGIPDEEILKASKGPICKVNIATDGWICALANTRRILDERKDAIDSRVFQLKNREYLKELYAHKIDILSSANRY